jgi:DNA primase
MRTLIAIVLRHPSLLPKLEDRLASLPLPAQARRLLEAMRTLADDGMDDSPDDASSLDFDTLLNHLTGLRLAEDAAWALGDVPLPLPACAGPAQTAEAAEVAWRGIYGLMRRSLLEKELAQARRDCAESFTAASVQRVEALAVALFGHAGAETAAENPAELGPDE